MSSRLTYKISITVKYTVVDKNVSVYLLNSSVMSNPS